MSATTPLHVLIENAEAEALRLGLSAGQTAHLIKRACGGVPQPIGVLRSSKAPRFVPCAGSFALEALYPDDEDSPEAREGTAAHFYVTEYLMGKAWPVGALAPNGHPLDADMIEHGQLYIDDVMATLAVIPAEARMALKVETKLTMHTLVHPENEGTPDTYLLSLIAKLLVLWDYKYGHKYVDPFMNWQLIDYVAGIFEAYGLTRADVADLRVSLRVIQPRNYHLSGPVRTWETTGGELWDIITQRLAPAAMLAKVPGAPTTTGEWCRDCNGRHACEAFMRVSARALDMAGETTPVELPPAALGLELDRIRTAIKRLEAREDGLQEQALAKIRQGVSVPPWTMGYVQSRERWNVPPAEVFAMGDIMGVELRAPLPPVTPAEARKRGVDPSLVRAYAINPTGAAKLVRVDETAAAKAFGEPPK